jgi:CheY-like chemotaxis protein
VLAVDDEPDACEVIQQILKGAGAEVRAACSAEEAIEALRAGVPDVLISDIGMPDQDGYALIRRVRAMDAKSGGTVPAIALTALARPQDTAAALGAGYQAHLIKPVDGAELIRTVAAMARGA